MQAFSDRLFLLPKKLLKQIDSMCRVFLWTGTDIPSRKAPVAWEKVCLPKVYGGLNLRALIPWNHAAILKLLWALTLKNDRLCVQWVHTYSEEQILDEHAYS